MTEYAARDNRAPTGRALVLPRPGRCVIQRCPTTVHIGMVMIPENIRTEMRQFNTIAKVLSVGEPLTEADKDIKAGDYVFIRPTPNHVIEESAGEFPVEVMAFAELLAKIDFLPDTARVDSNLIVAGV